MRWSTTQSVFSSFMQIKLNASTFVEMFYNNQIKEIDVICEFELENVIKNMLMQTGKYR